MTKLRIYMTSDVHGSDITFRKFVNAGRFYKADVVIMGGDLTGKRIVPIVKQKDETYTARLYGDAVLLHTKEDLLKFEQNVRDIGFYSIRTDTYKMRELDDERRVNELFSRLMIERLRNWIELIDRNLEGSPVRCFIQPGNDDSFLIDSVIEEARHVTNPEGKVIRLDDKHEMISTGYANFTPWNCPRDISESELAAKIEAMASKVEHMETCIFNFHCPPFDTGLDSAPQLDENLKLITKAGSPFMIPVGSKAVLDAIRKHEPELGLHGHIHESRGAYNCGRTLCINPGSEYSEGVLRGVIVELSDDKIRNYTFTSG